LQNFIKHNLHFDRIIFRYPNASEGLRNFSKAFYKKIVFEHNTKELEELRLQISAKNYVKFSLRPSQFFYWYQEKRYPLYAEKCISKKIMKNAFAGACVTTEIASYEKARFAGYRTFVSS